MNLEIYKPNFIKNISKDEEGSLPTVIGVGLLATGVMIGATIAGAYLGDGIGWLIGNGIEHLPYLNEVIPNLVSSIGLTPGENVTEDLFQTTGMISGSGGGMYGATMSLKSLVEN